MITLTDDQQNAINSLVSFLASDKDNMFVLTGYAGTGKSTLVHYFLDNIQNLLSAVKLVKPNLPGYTIELTATTNKAAENLEQIAKMETRTIHSFLGLRVETDYKTRETKLVSRRGQIFENLILIIDEASYIDNELLEHITSKVQRSKIIFIGDPAQLIPVKSKYAPVFKLNVPGAKLTKVMRQAQGNPILDLATKFRGTVNTGEFFSFTPDGNNVKYLDRDDFDQAIVGEFTRPDWCSQESKILAWTNKAVDAYNKVIANMTQGRTTFQRGDYAQCNKFYSYGRSSIKTDQLVLITNAEPEIDLHGVYGRYYEIHHSIKAFCPNSLLDKKALLKRAKADENWELIHEIEESWIDLRSVYACTINKSQGSTYDRVFIDLDDLKKCNSGEAMARLLYVGTSRPRHQLFLTGDLV